jgi:hypothetical protein
MHKLPCPGFDKEANVVIASLVRKLESLYSEKSNQQHQLGEVILLSKSNKLMKIGCSNFSNGEKEMAVLPPFLGCLAYSFSSHGDSLDASPSSLAPWGLATHPNLF